MADTQIMDTTEDEDAGMIDAPENMDETETGDADIQAQGTAGLASPQIAGNDNMRVLEALLFASAAPLSTSAIRERMGEDADVGGLLMQLKAAYEGRGVQLVELDGNWAFRTAGDLGDALQITKEVQRKLSRAAMETLAIIAYHQPVTRAEVENIRGVATHKGTLDVLMECGWIKPGRRRETPGRPLTWVTTTAFMDHFGLESMTDLPGLDDLKASGLLDRRPAIDTVPGTRDMFEGDDEGETVADDDGGNEDYEDDDGVYSAYEDDEDDEDDKDDNDNDDSDNAADPDYINDEEDDD